MAVLGPVSTVGSSSEEKVAKLQLLESGVHETRWCSVSE
jgi:hypothetical protein